MTTHALAATGHARLFTPQRVYAPLAELLPDFQPLDVQTDRASVQDEDAIASQVARSSARYAKDPDVRQYLAIPQEAWDAGRADLARVHGIRWIRERDVHPNATGGDVVAAVVGIGTTLFVRVTASAVKRTITQPDRDDENAYTLLVLAVVRHYATVDRYRWSEQPSRAARNGANFQLIREAIGVRGRTMRFGDRDANPSDPNDATLLAVLGAMGETDDTNRRKSMMGSRLARFWAGGMPKSEAQLPHGLVHERHPETGRVVKVTGKGAVAVCDPEFVPVLQQLVDMHAKGETYTAIGRHLARLEGEGHIQRRGQNITRTYRQLVAEGDRQGLYDAAKSLFVVNGYSPVTDPDLYLAKVRLWATGTYVHRQRNDLAGRATEIQGRTPEFASDDDVHGAWPLENEVGFPIVNGQPLVGWGIDAGTWQRVEARLLREVRTRRPTGGAAHEVAERRVLANFGDWTVDDGHYPDELTQMTVYARRNNSGKDNCILLRRPRSAATTLSGRPRGWTVQAGKPAEHVVATMSLRELTASVAHALHVAVLDGLLDPAAVASAVLVARRDVDQLCDQRSTLEARLEAVRADEQQKRTAAAALPQAIGLAAANGQDDVVKQLTASISTITAEADDLLARGDELQGQIDALTARLAALAHEQDATGDLSTLAYVVAGLRRAVNNGGRGPTRLGDIADTTFTDWRLVPDRVDDGDVVRWNATARLPLVDGGHADVPLAGWVSNVRKADGGALVSKAALARYVLHDGRGLDELAATLGHSRRSLVVQRLMPWLVDHGLTNRAAKCALVDHPVTAAKKVLHLHLAGNDHDADTAATAAWSPGWRRHLIQTYIDPDLSYGFAACPDDLRLAHQVAATLAAQHDRAAGVPIADLAGAAGVDIDTIREFAAPTKRASGWQRPAYFEPVPGDTGSVRLRACPHARCGGQASHVVLLPETVVGHGVFCPDCRRMPVPDLADVQLPTGYLQTITGTGTGGSLRHQDQTRAVDQAPPPLDVAAVTTLTVQQIASALRTTAGRVRYHLELLGVQGRKVNGRLRYPRAALDDVRRHLHRQAGCLDVGTTVTA